MKTNIWIFHHYADPPDGHWTGTYDLYKFLVAKGHSVTVFSSSFSHYTRREERLNPAEKSKVQFFNGMRFVFVRTAPYTGNDRRRFYNMLSYAVGSLVEAIKIKEKPDVVIGSTPHPFCLMTAIVVSKIKRCRFVMELHDLWMEFMIDTRMISPAGIPSRIVAAFDRYTYKTADRIFTLWPRMNVYLEGLGVPAGKISWIPLGLDFATTRLPESRRRKTGESFNVVCTARFGPASNIDEILEAAKIIKAENLGDIRFTLYGDGPEKEKLLAFASDNRLDNVVFGGMIPKSHVKDRLKLADVCISGLPDMPNYNKYGTIPTKLIDYMSANRAVIFISNVTDNLVARSGSGICVLPGRPDMLAEAIKKLYGMSVEDLAAMAKKGVEYLKKYHDLRALADKVELYLCSDKISGDATSDAV
jgi:glycosyltransferase involved in cell wall biosynthesis